MIYDFDTLPNRRETESFKWRAYPPDVLPMFVADMDFVSPQPVIEALQRRVAHGVFGYPYELPGLKETVVERMERLYGWKITPEEVVIVPGVVTALNQTVQAVVPAGGGVLVQTPVYPPFLTLAKNAGALDQRMELSRHPQGNYTVDWQAFDAAFTPETRLFTLCNPHNPVGRAFRRDELERMAEICLRHDVLICSDEIHCDLLYTGVQHFPIAALDAEVAKRTITLMAPSKTYNIAGLECSFAIIPDAALRKQFQHATHGLVGWVNVMGLVAGQAAYAHGQEWLEQVLVYLQANRDFLYEYVQRELPGVQMVKPEATYLAWLDCRGLGLPQDPYAFFLKEAKVAFNQGSTFGQGGEGFIRLNFGCPRSMLVEALERVKRCVL
jgi:cystathionine beta-lyase